MQLVGPAPRSHEEVLTFARENGVMGAGIGYVDAHLLASAYLDGRLLWSADSDVQRIADRLGVGFPRRPPVAPSWRPRMANAGELVDSGAVL